MATVNFRRGSQSDLDVLINGSGARYKEGSFYLTTDTNRLYFAQTDSKLVDLNQYIRVFANGTVDDLPTNTSTLKEGDIYYLGTPNVMAIWTGTAWKQINPDTYLKANEAAFSVTANAAQNIAVLNLALEDSAPSPHQVTGSMTIKGGDNVHVTADGTTITIAADNDTTDTTYALKTASGGTNSAKVQLDSTKDGDDSEIELVGSGSVSVSADANGKVTIRGTSAVTGISNAYGADGKFVTTLSLQGGDTLDSTAVTPTISYGKATASKQSATFNSGTAALDVYTTSEIDTLLAQKFNDLDAMKYLGTVTSGNYSTKLVAGANAGDTYKAASAFTYNGTKVKSGDLLIATGTDGNVAWEVVPSGDDQNIGLTLTPASNAFTITDSINSDLGSIAFAEDSDATASKINISSVKDDDTMTITLKHGDAGSGTDVGFGTTETQQAKNSITIPSVVGLSKDKHGHITSITTKTFTVVDTHAKLDDIQLSVQGNSNSNGGTFGLTFGLDSGSQSTGITLGLTSENLKITKDSDTALKINLEWESF